MQLDLFQTTGTSRYDKDGVDVSEAPGGFYATLKIDRGENICRQCDARQLCQENKNDWCMNNRCMSHEVFSTKYQRIIRRQDGKSVVFKRITYNNNN